MNKEEYKELFRQRILPKYVELAKNSPYEPFIYIQDKPVKYIPVQYWKCFRCGDIKPVAEFEGRSKVCNECKMKNPH